MRGHAKPPQLSGTLGHAAMKHGAYSPPSPAAWFMRRIASSVMSIASADATTSRRSKTTNAPLARTMSEMIPAASREKAAPRLFSRAVQKPPFLVLFGAELLDSGVEGIRKIPEFLGRQFRSPIGQIPFLRNELVLDPLVFPRQASGPRAQSRPARTHPVASLSAACPDQLSGLALQLARKRHRKAGRRTRRGPQAAA